MNNGLTVTQLTDPRVVYLTDNEIAVDIWLFIKGKKTFTIKGLYRDGIISRLEQKGYCKRYRDNRTYLFIRQQDNIIEEVEAHQMKDEVFGYVKTISDPLEFVCDGYCVEVSPEKLREVFENQSHLIFNDNFLEHLPIHTTPLLKATKDEAYFFFSNAAVKVTHEGIEAVEYKELSSGCIWRSHIIPREITLTINPDEFGTCHFAKFIRNVSANAPDRIESFGTAIGYLLHNYSDPSKGQAVVCYDEQITDLKNPMGGTGKGLFANAIGQMAEKAKIDGKKFDSGDKFRYQGVSESTQVVWIDDVRPDFEFETLHSRLTDGWNIEKKHQSEIYIKPEDSPKVLICSNAVLSSGGTTNKRRQFIVEFSDHYSRQIKTGVEEPIRKEHGCIFFSQDWDAREWSLFYSYMLDCVWKYLNKGLVTYEYRGLSQNQLRQTTSEEFCQWVVEKELTADVDYNTEESFSDFVTTYYGTGSDFKQRSFTNYLKKYASIKGYEMRVKRSNNVQYFRFNSR